MCNHADLVFGEAYLIKARGTCDGCGSSHRLDDVLAIYIGDSVMGHHFEIAPFGCPGCHKTIDHYNVPCEGLNVTLEFQDIKAKA